MAASPSASVRRSPASSAQSLKASSSHHDNSSSRAESTEHDLRSSSSSFSIPIDTLVNHLLASKRSLSSMNHLLRANALATSARHIHEDLLLSASHAEFLRTSVIDEAAILVRLRRSLQTAYDWGKRDFRRLVEAMDEADGELGATMGMLRRTVVQKELRPEGEEERNLLDFVDEESVHGMRDAMKKSIEQLQGYQQSFDGDLLRFDTDIRSLKKLIIDSALPSPSDIKFPNQDPEDEEEEDQRNKNADEDDDDDDEDLTDHATRLLATITDDASNMASLLASLTKHFDMCVTAIRTTEGAADLARRKAANANANASNSADDTVSISGVIAEQGAHNEDLTPKTPRDRAEMLRVVVQDAQEVDDVVHEITLLLNSAESAHARISHLRSLVLTSLSRTLTSHTLLSTISTRLPSYLLSEDDFLTRWTLEKESVTTHLSSMRSMRDFYEGYASAYSSLLLEAERRKGVEDKIQGAWRKAAEVVRKVVEGDERAREAFREDVGEFLPTDLWEGLREGGRVRRWEVVPVIEDEEEEVEGEGKGKGKGRR
ncbi:autophagy protein apg17 domain-containing protein [Sarocladium implicatum]|nr:autophagy protein apg17 domain-containing protein [Sarocladium implicatum]